MQGRFWRDSFGQLGLPESSAAKFAFEDGYDRVFTEDEPDEDPKSRPPVKGRFQKINWLRAGILSADKVPLRDIACAEYAKLCTGHVCIGTGL